MFDRLQDLFGNDPKRADEYRDFERRYRENPDQISDEEAARRYREMMAAMGDDEDDTELQGYEKAFSQLSHEERVKLAQRYLEASNDPNRSFEGYKFDDNLEEAAQPRELGRMTKQAAKKDPDLLEQIFGQDSPLSSRTGKMVLAGLAAFAASRFLGRR